MQQTPFTEIHRALGAKMAEFAGYEMPIEYAGITAEHLCVCRNVGVFDVSHMGEFRLTGKQSLPLLQHLASNDVSQVPAGKAQYTCLMNEHGGVVDDFLIYCVKPEQDYFLVVNASNIDKDFAHFARYAPQFGVSVGTDLVNISEQIAQLAVQGPNAMKVLQSLVDEPITDMPYYSFKEVRLAGIPNVLLATTGYTGAGGAELYVDKQNAVALWNAVMQAGKAFGIAPIGLGARDTLRLEMGYCLYGHELLDDITPLEANLGWITKLSKNFLGADILRQQKEKGLQRKLLAFQLLERGVPRAGYEICNGEGRKIGAVTSGTMSPLSKEGIGLGYAETLYSTLGTPLCIKIREKLVPAQVVKLPFRKL
ncbi:aminomethyltransferase [Bacteroidia bacterium]|nr:aminomethyltransferase [Bacteroidia bacterium]